MTIRETYQVIDQLKKQFRTAFTLWDPAGLMSCPSIPEDEYEPEIDELINLLHDCQSPEDLAFEIRYIFEHWVGQASAHECWLAAHHIWKFLVELEKGNL